MSTPDSYVTGAVFYEGSKEDLAQILVDAGFAVRIGHWALHLSDCARSFALRYVGNISPDEPFHVDGDGYGVEIEQVADCCLRLSQCLQQNRIGFDFLHVTPEGDELSEYRFVPSPSS